MPGDTRFGGVMVVNHAINQLQHGHGYRASHHITGLAAGGTQHLQIDVPDTTRRVFWTRPMITTDADDITVALLENPDAVTDGTVPIKAFNNERGSNKSTAVNMFSDPSSVTEGAAKKIEETFIPGQKGKVVQGAVVNLSVEWWLKSNTTYLRKVVNGGAGNVDVGFEWFWYERTV